MRDDKYLIAIRNLLEDHKNFFDHLWIKLYYLSQIFKDEKFLYDYISAIRDMSTDKEKQLKEFMDRWRDQSIL